MSGPVLSAPVELLGQLSGSLSKALHHPGLYDRLFKLPSRFRLLPGPDSSLLETYLCLSFVYFAQSLIVYFAFPHIFRIKKIQPPSRKNLIPQEVATSLVSLLIKASVSVFCEELHRAGYAATYAKSEVYDAKNIAYVVFSLLLLDFIVDTWFYWVHRLLHWGPLYRHIHLWHHKSVTPSVFSSYSFHPVEGLLTFGGHILVQLVLPISAKMTRIYRYIDVFVHVGGHIGWELAPFGPYPTAIVLLAINGLRYNPALTTVQHHDQHHRSPNKNFALLFTHWDRWCGTLHQNYEQDMFWYWDPKRAPTFDDDKSPKKKKDN